jgi:hypothetical protein
MKRFGKTPSSQLWKMVAFGVAELAQRGDDHSTSPRVEVRRINGGQPQATITVTFEDARPGVPPLICVANSTLNKRRQHHSEAFTVDATTVSRINRRAYRESSSGVV